ncbi:Uncharacterised protein [Fluoribacter dumoffii]|uniref:Uncharacterized protein n=1 Tax=Fluoribacter dumoffii TaxID=463 RepID=A0A377G615_9GAMM|nr:Uncharacterised protein [Fluoribacter dumoffii]
MSGVYLPAETLQEAVPGLTALIEVQSIRKKSKSYFVGIKLSGISL